MFCRGSDVWPEACLECGARVCTYHYPERPQDWICLACCKRKKIDVPDKYNACSLKYKVCVVDPQPLLVIVLLDSRLGTIPPKRAIHFHLWPRFKVLNPNGLQFSQINSDDDISTLESIREKIYHWIERNPSGRFVLWAMESPAPELEETIETAFQGIFRALGDNLANIVLSTSPIVLLLNRAKVTEEEIMKSHAVVRKASYVLTFTGLFAPERHVLPLGRFLELTTIECLPPITALVKSYGGTYSYLVRDCSPVILYPDGTASQMLQEGPSRPWGVQLSRCACGVHPSNWKRTPEYHVLTCRGCRTNRSVQKPRDARKTISSMFYELPWPLNSN